VHVSVVDRDRGAKALMKRASDLKGRVRVGILADAPKTEASTEGAGESEEEPLSLLEVAAIHEFGAPDAGIPMRSFIRATVDQHADEIKRLQAVLAGHVIAGRMTEDQALNALGAKVAGWMQARIAAGIEPPLAPETIERKAGGKGGSTPLINTGQLRSAITWKVEAG